MVSSTILGVCINFFSYSPRWLALVDRSEECMASLSRLRGLPTTDARVQAEYSGILSEVVFQRLVVEQTQPGVKGWKLELHSWLDLLKKKRIGAGLLLQLVCAFSSILRG
jgi:hypothetical protein